MRDRRNTNLSTSSTFSSDSAVSGSSRLSLHEKRMSDSSPTLFPLLKPGTKENHSRPNAPSRLAIAIRSLALVCGILALWYFCFSESNRSLRGYFLASDVFRPQQTSVEQSLPTDQPSVVKLSNTRGEARWTIQIPHNYSFPLQSKHTKELCKQSEALRNEFTPQSRITAVKEWRQKAGYYSKDNTFLDIAEAEGMGALPQPDVEAPGRVCDKSLTFAFDLDDDSFGKSLLMLWLSYGLAKKEGRAFFVDDTRWLYGRYTSFFAPPPQPGCIPPPRHHIVPCPRNADHLFVSSASVPWTFGASFEREFSQTWKSGAGKNRRIYDLLRTGFEDLFHLTGEHSLYAASRTAKFKEDAHQHGSSVIGIHLRRGDLHPFEFQFSQDYLPLERYGAAARTLLHGSHSPSPPPATPDANPDHCPLLLATDDPEIFDSPELQHSASPYRIQRVQERIRLATKATLDLSSPPAAAAEQPDADPSSMYTKHVDENAGWEGGFYSALFFALGKPSANRAGQQAASTRPDGADEALFAEQAVQMRQLVGQAYLLDLAVLGESDGIVCASSSATCRLLAVMLGWEALKAGAWVNVDDGRAWSWDGRR